MKIDVKNVLESNLKQKTKLRWRFPSPPVIARGYSLPQWLNIIKPTVIETSGQNKIGK